MIRSRFASLAAIAFLGCMAFAAAAYNTVAPRLIAAARAVKTWALDGFKLAAQVDAPLSRPAVVMVQAKAFVLRLAKRERPQLSGSWRMCPST